MEIQIQSKHTANISQLINMKALHIIIPDKNKDYYTSDFIDVINELELLPKGAKMEITTQTMTPQEFTKLTESNGSSESDKE